MVEKNISSNPSSYKTKKPRDHMPIGKRVGTSLYVHQDAFDSLTSTEKDTIKAAKNLAGLGESQFNVAKLAGNRVSLLLYQEFDSHPFPALLESFSVDVSASTVKHTNYHTSANPPILHRKELLLGSSHPDYEKYKNLTEQLEERNLFKETKRIGNKHQWAEKLRMEGIEIKGHEVRETIVPEQPEKPNPEVARHKTAISRYGLSQPMQALVRHGLLNDEASIFDYGCGQGDDHAALRAAGLTADGWDPHYFPKAKKKSADIVNLGFVLNVIEDASERIKTLKSAYKLAKQCLSVGVMVWGKGKTEGLKRHNDGHLTKRGTFQKYFNQGEIKNLIETALDQEAISVGPGIFFVFRDKLAEQNFLTNRYRRFRDISSLLTLLNIRPKQKTNKDLLLLESHPELIKEFWSAMLELGRLPDPTELANIEAEEIRNRLGSFRTAARLAQLTYNPEALAEARQSRIDDLRVYFSLNFFSQRKPYKHLPDPLRRDIKAFFGNYRAAQDLGRELLFSVANTEAILAACQAASEEGLGHLDGSHSLQLHASIVDRLPATLRVYLGCAEVLYGDLEDIDLVKIHIQSGKVSLLKFDRFESSPLPMLKERIKIRLRDQDIEFFEYGGEYPSSILYMKSIFMAHDQKGYRRQKKFDDALSNLPSIDLSNFGPTPKELEKILSINKKEIKDFTIIAKT